jgi:hypothetical protein
MPAAEPLCRLVGIDPAKLTKEVNLILEVELFTRLCEALKDGFKEKYRDYFRIVKCTVEVENAIVEANFVRCVINDILSTEEYTLDGIACYTQTPEEVVHELAIGWNTSPSAVLLRKIVELHRTVRRELYEDMMKKISATILVPE